MMRLSSTRTMGRRVAKGRNANHGSHMFHMRGKPISKWFPEAMSAQTSRFTETGRTKNLRPMPRGENLNRQKPEELA